MSAGNIIFLMIPGGVMCLLFGWSSVGVVQVLLKLRRPERMTIASPAAATWPEEHKETTARLRALGFHELGVAIAIGSLDGKPQYLAVYVSDNDDIAAKISYDHNRKLWATFQTYFRSNALLLTRFPLARHIEKPHFHVHPVSTSLEAAFEYHLQHLAIWKQAQQEPQKTHNMGDVLRQHEIYNAKYVREERLWFTQTFQMVLVRNLILISTGLSLVIASMQELQWFPFVLILLLTPLAVGMSVRISHRWRLDIITGQQGQE